MTVKWDGPLQFEGGEPIKLFGTLNREGKIRYADGRPSEFAETWAEEFSHGLSRIIVTENNRRMGYSEAGVPVQAWDSECGLTLGRKLVVNVPPVSEASIAAMAENEMWGMF